MNTTKTTAETVAAGLAAEDAAPADFERRHNLKPGQSICVLGFKGCVIVKETNEAGFVFTDNRKQIFSLPWDGEYFVPANAVAASAWLRAQDAAANAPEFSGHENPGDEKGESPAVASGEAAAGDPPSAGDAFADEVLAPDTDESEPAPHKVSIRVGDKYYPARISPALTAMPDWRGEPEYGRLVASAGRDQKFQQPVLGKLVIAGSKAMPVQYFEIEDGRHRFWAAEEQKLAFVEGKVTEMPVAELMLRSLLERRHLEKGARAYLAWPVIQPFVAANKEVRKSNLKRGREKGEASRNPANGISETATLSDVAESQLPEAEAKRFKELADSYGIGHTLLDQARRVHEIFARRKDLKLENEPLILAGELGLGACIAGVAGKEATEGKERKDTPPADLLRRSFRDLRIRFAADRWNAIPDTDRHTVAGELVETVLDLPEDVRTRLKLALA